MPSNVSRITSVIGPWPDEPDYVDYHRNKRIRAMVRKAAGHSPYYRELFKCLSLQPDDICTIQDLKKLPVLERNTVRHRAQELMSDGILPGHCRMERTNGTTGEPTIIYNSPFEVWFQHALWITGYMRYGLRPWHRQAKFIMGNSIPAKKQFFQHLGLLRRSYMAVSQPPAAKVQWLREFKPDVLFTWGSVLNEMWINLEETKSELHVPLIFSSSDTVLRDQVSTRIKGRLLDIYGATESGPMGWPCMNGDGYHIDPRWVVVEILNEIGEPADRGFIVCTPLWRRTMPLIRYRLDDIGEWETRPCECGCPWPKIKSLIGRQSDLFTLPSGVQVTTGFVAEIIRTSSGILQYQLIQKSPKDNYLFIIPGPDFSERTIDDLQHKFTDKLHDSDCLRIKTVSYLYRPPNEKFRAIFTLMGIERMKKKGIDVDTFYTQ